MKLIVGLGNPGREYEGTRHNVGFAVVEKLSIRHSIGMSRQGFRSRYGEGQIADERIVLLRPLTYMNLSGQAVLAAAQFYKLAPADLLVVLDDVALPPGQIRLRYKGSAGGHNGLANILDLLHTQEVPRIRVGVGGARPGDLVNHVLSRFGREDALVIEAAVDLAADAAEAAVALGFEGAMNRFNPAKTRANKGAELD